MGQIVMQKKHKIILGSLVIISLLLGGTILYKQNEQKNYVNLNNESVFDSISQKKDGIYIFFFPECPWCKEIVPEIKKEAIENKIYVNLVNVHNSKYTQKDKKPLKTIIMKTGNGNEIIVPFILVIRNHKIIKAQIGLISPNIKENRHSLIQNEVQKLLQL